MYSQKNAWNKRQKQIKDLPYSKDVKVWREKLRVWTIIREFETVNDGRSLS